MNIRKVIAAVLAVGLSLAMFGASRVSAVGAEVVAVSPSQPLQLDLGDGRLSDVRFEFNARAGEDSPAGWANGQQLFFAGKLRIQGPVNAKPKEIVVVGSKIKTNLVRSDQGRVVLFAGDVEWCTTSGGCALVPLSGSVRPSASSEGRLTYDVVGPEIHWLFEASGTFVVRS